jgi:hypothetical protein
MAVILLPADEPTPAKHLRVAQMPNDKDNSRDHSQDGEGRFLRNFILLTLPWLSFQREMLAIMKRGIENASHVRPIENLTLRELQALMMIFDPSGKWRNLIDSDLQEGIKETYTKTFPKLVSGLVLSIEAQEEVLASISGLFDKLRKNNKPSDGPGKKPAGQSK